MHSHFSRFFSGACSTIWGLVGVLLVVSGTLFWVVWASAPSVTIATISSDGYVNATEDDAGVAAEVTVNEWATVSGSFSDGTDTVTKTGVMSGSVYAETLSSSVSALSLSNGDELGNSVARSGDMLAIGAVASDRGGTNRGAVYLVKDSDGDGDFSDATSNDVTIIDSNTAGISIVNYHYFGWSVALDEDVLVVGVPTHTSSKGKVYVISDGGDEWGSVQEGDVVKIQTGTAGLSLDANDRFGISVAINDGLLAVGTPYDDTGGTDRGAVYLIDDGADNSFSTLSASDVTTLSSSTNGISISDDHRFGSAVAFDDDLLAIGASGCSGCGSVAGAVFLIDDGTDDWGSVQSTDVTKIDSGTNGLSPANADNFGFSVALGDDMLAVGALNDDTGGTNKGAVYLIKGGGDDWGSVQSSDVVKLSESSDNISLGNGDKFGSGVALDGGTLAVGVPYSDAGGENRGKVYMFDPEFEVILDSSDFEKDGTPTDGDSKLAAGTVTLTTTVTDVDSTTTTSTKSFTYDPVVPTVSSAVYNPVGRLVTITTSKNVYGMLNTSNFSVSGGGNPSISSISGLSPTKSDAGTVFILTLSSTLTGGASLSYTQDSGDTTKRATDLAGNAVASFSSQTLLDQLGAVISPISSVAAEVKNDYYFQCYEWCGSSI